MNQGATVKSKNKTPKTSPVSKTGKASFGLSRGARRRVKGTAPNAAHLKLAKGPIEMAPLILVRQGSQRDDVSLILLAA